MTYYLIPFFFLTFCTLFERAKKFSFFIKNKYIYFLIAIIFILFIGFRYEVGCDWVSYKNMITQYSDVSLAKVIRYTFIEKDPVILNQSGLKSYHVLHEIGHIFISFISRNIYILNLIYSTIFIIPLFYFCYQIKSKYLALLISYPYYIVVVGMGPIRQAACISLLMISIILLSKNKYLWHFLISTFSLSIHQYSIFFNTLLLTPLFPKFYKDHFSKKFILLFLIVVIIISYNLPSYILKTYYYLILPDSIIPPARGAFFVWLINFFPALIYLRNIQKFNFNRNLNKILITLSIFEITLLPLVFLKSVIAYRLLLYLFPSSIYITSYIPNLKYTNISKIINIKTLIFLSLISLVIWLKFAYHASCWIPYRNILFN